MKPLLIRAALLAFPMLLAARVSPVPKTAEGPPDAGWRDGPVRYLLTRPEYDRYGRLETDAARAAFVARFWHRYDADPATPENEFRERFEARSADAIRRFEAHAARIDAGPHSRLQQNVGVAP